MAGALGEALVALVEGRLPGVRIDTAAMATDAEAPDPRVALDRVLATLLNGRASADTRRVLEGQLGDVAKLTALVLGSPEFQRR